MDAFLKPSEKTDATGQPLRLKTVEFYKGLREHLTPDGIVVINLNVHQGTNDDLATIRGAYPQAYTFQASTPNLIVVCTWDKTRVTAAALHEKARSSTAASRPRSRSRACWRRWRVSRSMHQSNNTPPRPIDRRHAQAVQFPDPPPRVRLLHDPAEGLEQLPLVGRQRRPAAANGRAGPWPVRAIARSSSSRSPSAAAIPPGCRATRSKRPPGWRWPRDGDTPASGTSRQAISPALAAQRASHQSCEAATSGSGKASSRSGRFTAQAQPSTKLRPNSVFNGRPEPIGQPVLTQERGMHRPPRGIDHRRIAIDQPRKLSPAAVFRVLQGLHLPGDFLGMPDVVLIGRQDVVGPVVPGLLAEARQNCPPLPAAGRRPGR